MKKTLTSKIISGIKSGWELPILPDHILKLDQNRYVKIFKFIGSICVALILSKIGEQLPIHNIFYYILYIINMIYILYKIVLSIYVVKQWFHNLFTGQFIVRNSPLEPVHIILKGTFNTLKGVATFTVGTGMAYPLCHELDDILVKGGKEPYFVPGIRKALVASGLEDLAKQFLNKLDIKDKVNTSDPISIQDYITKMSSSEKNEFEKISGIKIDDYKKVLEIIQDMKKQNSTSSVVSSDVETVDPFKTKSGK